MGEGHHGVKNMKEIGGYIELDSFCGEKYHKDAIELNCGRNCLAYLIEAKRIKKLYIPYFMCSTAKEICCRYGIPYQYYKIDNNFLLADIINVHNKEFVYIVNYYGALEDQKILEYYAKWNNIIVDNTQDFFRRPIKGIDTLYSCRKYFGVSDGAYLYTDCKINRQFDQDVSLDRIHYILGRFEKNASEFYLESIENNAFFKTQPIKEMSKLTKNILSAIDYDGICQKRYKNFEYVHRKLASINKISEKALRGNFMYPLLVDNGITLRRKLQERKIYIPVLWPEVLDICNEGAVEFVFAENLLPLPIDQRYEIEDMEYMCNIIIEIYKETNMINRSY